MSDVKKREDRTMNNPDVRASSERMVSLAEQNVSIDFVPAFPELVSLGADIKTMLLAFEAELEDFSKHNSACADENDTLRDEVSMLESTVETQSAEIERLRAALAEIKQYDEGGFCGRIAHCALKGSKS